MQGEVGRGRAVQGEGGEGGWGGKRVGNGRQDRTGGWVKMRGRRTAGTPCTLFQIHSTDTRAHTRDLAQIATPADSLLSNLKLEGANL